MTTWGSFAITSLKDSIYTRIAFPLSPAMLMAKAKKNMIVLHPLPRNNEIDKCIDADTRCAYFRQMKYGVYVRMALLEMLLDMSK